VSAFWQMILPHFYGFATRPFVLAFHDEWWLHISTSEHALSSICTTYLFLSAPGSFAFHFTSPADGFLLNFCGSRSEPCRSSAPENKFLRVFEKFAAMWFRFRLRPRFSRLLFSFSCLLCN
jgi:hypothetical protein